MNTQLATTPRRQDHPPQPVPAERWRPVRRVGLLDRAALHLGVALITWGRRPVKPEPHEWLASYTELVEARRKREERHDQYELWGANLTRMR